jgi:hypothetical protein
LLVAKSLIVNIIAKFATILIQIISQAIAKPNQNLQTINQNRCKIPKCTENHKQHFCKVCQDPDSDHFSSDCPINDIQIPTTNIKQSKLMCCKIPDCTHSHTVDFVKIKIRTI